MSFSVIDSFTLQLILFLFMCIMIELSFHQLSVAWWTKPLGLLDSGNFWRKLIEFGPFEVEGAGRYFGCGKNSFYPFDGWKYNSTCLKFLLKSFKKKKKKKKENLYEYRKRMGKYHLHFKKWEKALFLFYPYTNLVIVMLLFQGGISFVAVKGVVRIYYRQQQYVRQAQRIVKNYGEE